MRARSRPSKYSARPGHAPAGHYRDPGLTTGAADDDPSGIATYSASRGAVRLRAHLDHAAHSPSMAAIQIISARLGWQTGRGLTKAIGQRFPAPLLYAPVASLVGANTHNIAADLSAMGARCACCSRPGGRLHARIWSWVPHGHVLAPMTVTRVTSNS